MNANREPIGDTIDLTRDIAIICPQHGEFVVNAQAHLDGEGCPHCKHHITHDGTDIVDRIAQSLSVVNQMYGINMYIYAFDIDSGTGWIYDDSGMLTLNFHVVGQHIHTISGGWKDPFYMDGHGTTYPCYIGTLVDQIIDNIPEKPLDKTKRGSREEFVSRNPDVPREIVDYIYRI